MNVFDIEDLGATGGVGTASSKGKKGTAAATTATTGGGRAVVARPRDCTMCRECIRKVDEGWDQRIQLRRKADHFLFSVEAVGTDDPGNIVREVCTLYSALYNFSLVFFFVCLFCICCFLNVCTLLMHVWFFLHVLFVMFGTGVHFSYKYWDSLFIFSL
jgi:NAD-dependent dihydropyrimidine dehydrogenase PreA subunit